MTATSPDCFQYLLDGPYLFCYWIGEVEVFFFNCSLPPLPAWVVHPRHKSLKVVGHHWSKMWCCVSGQWGSRKTVSFNMYTLGPIPLGLPVSRMCVLLVTTVEKWPWSRLLECWQDARAFLGIQTGWQQPTKESKGEVGRAPGRERNRGRETAGGVCEPSCHSACQIIPPLLAASLPPFWLAPAK